MNSAGFITYRVNDLIIDSNFDPFLPPLEGEIISITPRDSEGYFDIDKPEKRYVVKSIEYGKELTSWGSPEETIVNLEEV